MNSFAIGWKKQTPDAVQFSTKKKYVLNRPLQKILPKKQQQQTSQITEISQIQKPRFDPLLQEKHLYTSLSKETDNSKLSNSFSDEIQIYDNKKLCTVRAAIATFIIIFILVIAAGASVGVAFGIVSSSSSNGTNNQNSFTTGSSGLLTSSIKYGSQTGSPCTGYTEVNDPTRSKTHVSTYGTCDDGPLFNTSNGGVWIRFVGSGGTTIPLASVGMNHCGGFLSSWYNASLPTTVNDITNGTVCFETPNHECGFIVDVSVVYCNPYYVYFLPPINACNARYCTE